MSDKKPTNILNMKSVDDDQSHSDSDDSTEETPKALLKTEKKKPLTSNFGRPRKHPYKPGKYKCMYCETMCSKPSVLTKHLRAHTNERPFPCGLCKRSFKTKSNLSKHEKSKSHSSKLEENSVVHNKQSKREKAEMMLQALSGMESMYPRHVESMTNIEFDSNERKTSIVESNCSSPALSEDKSINSEENCVHDNVKKEKHVDHVSSFSEDIPGKVENASSCSGVLTINSQAGPITVEVQINLETMRQLQQGLSNITNKKITSPLSPVPVATPRNDAELRAAESILHMANQWTHIPETLNSKDDFRKNGATVRKLPDTLSPLHRGSPDMINFGKTNVTKPLSSKDSNSNKSTPLEESDMVNFKNQTKCLVKENLLKKMKRKQVQENNNISSAADSPVINGPVLINHVFSNSKTTSDKVTESVLSPSISRASHFKFNQSHIRSDSMLKNLIADSKSTTVLSIKANKRGPGICPNPQILNSFSISSQSPTIVVFTPTSNTTKTLLSDSKSVSDMTLVSNTQSNNNKANFDIDTATLSKVITNTQSLHQHQATTASNADILSVTNSITASRVATVSSPCIESDSKENMSVENVNELVIDEQSIEDDKSEKQPFSKKTSIQTSQESENELSPRLCIVEESSNLEAYVFDKKLTESDEEIDVVNTDSDEERLSLQRIPQVNYSESASKRRKLTCDDDSEIVQSDTKRVKEVEKCVPLHAPNINAKDLMQDCPLNLSANRQPTILPVPPIPVSVLHNLYQSISPSSVSVSSSINSTTAQETSSPISALTNHNPAHPQSFQNFQSTTPLSTNGHHRDYPIFEDKIACEECGSLIEPSMVALHNNMHIYTSGKDSHLHGNNNTKSGSSITHVNNSNNNNSSSTSSSSKISFNRPRSYKCVVCDIAFRVIGHLRKHHKSKSHLQGLVNSGLLSKTLFSKIEQSKVPIQEVIDQKTGNIIPDVLSRYISNLSQANNESEPQH